MEITQEQQDAVDAMFESFSDGSAIQQELNDEIKATANSFSDMDETTDSVTESQLALTQAGKETTDVITGYSKGLKGLTVATAKMVKSFTAGGESLDSLREFIAPIQGIVETTFSALGSVVSGVSSGLGNIMALFPGVGDMLSGFMDGLGDLAKGLFDKLGKAIGAVAGMLAEAMLGALEEALSMFKGATSAGLLFTDGMKGMVGQMNDLMLFQDEYVQVVQKNAQALTIVGGTVADGMNKITKSVKLFDTTFMTAGISMRDELYNMGIGYQEMTEGTVEYMEQLARTGNLQGLTADQLALQTGEYLKNLKVVSALTGKSADEMKKERDEALGNLAFRNKLSKLSADQQKEIMTAMARVPEEGQKAFKEAVVFGKVMTDVGAITTGMAGHYEGLAAELLSGTSNAKDAISGFLGGIKADLPRLEKAFQGLDAVGQAALVGAGNSITDAINDSVAGQIALAAQAGEFTQAKYDAAWEAGAGKGALGLQDFFEDLREVYGTVTDLLVQNSDVLIGAAKSASAFVSSIITSFATEWKSGDFSFLDFITEQVKKLFGTKDGDSLTGGIANDVMEALGVATMWETISTFFSDLKTGFDEMFQDVKRAMARIENFSLNPFSGQTESEAKDTMAANTRRRREEASAATAALPEGPLKSQQEIAQLRLDIKNLQTEKDTSQWSRKEDNPDYKGPTRGEEITAMTEKMDLMIEELSKQRKLTEEVSKNTAAVI